MLRFVLAWDKPGTRGPDRIKRLPCSTFYPFGMILRRRKGGLWRALGTGRRRDAPARTALQPAGDPGVVVPHNRERGRAQHHRPDGQDAAIAGGMPPACGVPAARGMAR